MQEILHVTSPSTSTETSQSTITFRETFERAFHSCRLVRPLRCDRYEPGEVLHYDIRGVFPDLRGRLSVVVEKFVGGGFAGQVYRVKVRSLDIEEGMIPGLEQGKTYAIKILRPPSKFANRFRNFLYKIGYQSDFSPQVHPAAVRVGVLWQKLIRRAATYVYGDERSVCDTYATFYDTNMRSFGEINEWVDGRIWKFEEDDDLFHRWDFTGDPPSDHQSREYVYKKRFMEKLVRLLHDMGAPEFARQYEWWTCKSQPNVLKRTDRENEPSEGLTAIDFRAGLVLLPFLPMSPADIKLIVTGLLHGRIVQFDRSDLARLEGFLDKHRDWFTGMEKLVQELVRVEQEYRSSQIDIARHHIRFIWDRSLRRSVKDGIVTSWLHLGIIDDETASVLHAKPFAFFGMLLVSFLPFIGHRFVAWIGDAQTREHINRCLSEPRYLLRAIRGSRIESLILWVRDTRTTEARARKLANRPFRFFLEQITVGLLPAKWHRFFSDPRWAISRLNEIADFVSQFLRIPEFREQRLIEQVEMGRDEGMLTGAEADRIVSEIKDPYIQKYLKCLAVHLCTVPITQIFMVIAGATVTVYCLMYRGLSWPESVGLGSAAAATIQLLPISPGSTTRGIFVLYLMIRERDIKNYYIAAPVSFIHVLGYLAFPLQMVTHNPALARFLAGRWTRDTIHIIPVFGEKGALLEHAVFDFFFNVPISIRRGFKTNPVTWWIRTILFLTFLGSLGYWLYLVLH